MTSSVDETLPDQIRSRCLEGLVERYANRPDRLDGDQLCGEVLNRLDHELEMLHVHGMENTFLAVTEAVRFARERRIPILSRGHTGGLLIAYALGLSHACPLDYGLWAECFFNGIYSPEFQIDIPANRRAEILQHLQQSWGANRISTKPSKIIPEERSTILFTDETTSRQVRFIPTHQLALLGQVVAHIEDLTREKIDPYEISRADEDTWATLRQGDAENVFPFASVGIQAFLRSLRPTCLNDLVAAIALYRPQPWESGVARSFVRTRRGRQSFQEQPPEVTGLLDDTYGHLIYDEQAIRLLSELGGVSPLDAYWIVITCRRDAFGQIDTYRRELLDRAKENGFETSLALELFSWIETQIPGLIARSHCFGYAFIGYVTAFFKTHYPNVFSDAIHEVKRSTARAAVLRGD